MLSDKKFLTPRHIADIGLLVASVGGSIPFGLHNPHTYAHLNAYEWILTGFMIVTVGGIIADLIRPPDLPWPFLLAAFTWASAATYAAFLPGATWPTRVAIALIFGGYAVASGGIWRITAVQQGSEL